MDLLKIVVCAGVMAAFAGFAQETAAPVEPPAGTNSVAATGLDETGEPASETKEMTTLDVWVDNLRKGGATMYFLALLSILGLATALERAVNLRKNKIVPDNLTVEAMELWKARKFAELSMLCAKSKSVLGRVIETLLEQRGNNDVAQVKMFAEDKAGRELRLENRRSYMLSVVATISPLLGLFGTVLGLLGAFSTVARMGDMGDPSAMADDIGKALVTTVAGLIIAMPALFMYHVYRSRINLYAVLLEEELSALVNAWFVKKG